MRAAPFLDVHEVLVPELLERRHDRPRGGLAERADGRAVRRPGQADVDLAGHVEQELEVFLATVPALDAVHRLLEPAGALTTRRALAAGLVREEADEVVGGA